MDRAAQAVAELPGLHEALALALRRQSRGGQRVSGQGETPPFICGPVADHREHITRTVASWCTLVVEGRRVTAPRSALPAVTCPWLTRHLDWAVGQSWAADLCTEMLELWGRARALAYPSGRRRVPCGPCVEMVDGQRCPGTLTASVAATDDLLPGLLVCDYDSEHAWPASAWLDLGERIHNGISEVA